MSYSISVRRAVESDAERLLRLRQALFAETEFLLWEPGEFKDTVEDEARRIARLTSQRNSTCLVAEDGVDMVGMLNAMGSTVNRLRHSTSLGLGVLSSHWGRGVGAALVSTVLSWSSEVRLRRVELTVHTTNDRAIQLYKRCGFEVEGIRRSSLLVNGTYRDEYLMSVLNEV